MRVGFTGTRGGMTGPQLLSLHRWLTDNPATEYHDGDCVGADDQFFRTCRYFAHAFAAKTHAHPCDIPSQRAFNHHDVLHDPEQPLVRNRDIVDAVDVMLACPAGMQEEQRSGTWMTIRYARKQKRRIEIFWPDGTVTEEK